MLKDDINSVYFYQCYQYGSALMPHQKKHKQISITL